ncbi:MAG: type VI secretion system protein TssA [Pseudomonadota bacterium]
MIQERQGHNNPEPFYLDMEKLLIPIPGENPAGEFLRYEGTYDRIQEARKEEEDLPQGVWKRELKKADWPVVRDICIQVLEERSKDFQIAAWLLEALLHLHGFLGLREGLKLLFAFCERFWERLYPEIEGEDLEARISPMVWLNEKLYVQIKIAPITQPESAEGSSCSFADWEKANYLENIAAGEERVPEKASTKGTLSRAKFLGSVMFTPKSFYEAQSQYLADSVVFLTDLQGFLDEKCGKQAPTLNRFRDTIEDIQRTVNDFLTEKQSEERDYESETSISEVHEEESYPAQEEMEDISEGPLTTSIRSRSEAYRMLSEAADYLMIHEPHSPTPYLVKRAVSWGNMTLTELLKELVGEERNLLQVYKLLGIKGPDRI